MVIVAFRASLARGRPLFKQIQRGISELSATVRKAKQQVQELTGQYLVDRPQS
jgi:hypothetical protein